MNQTNRSFQALFLVLFVVLSAHCGNPTSNTSRSNNLATEGSSSPRAALSGSTVAPQLTEERSLALVEAAPAPSTRERLPSVARGAEGQTPRRATAPATAGLSVRRLVVSRDVANREPLGAAESFPGDHDRLFAFVEASNPTDDSKELQVVFESEGGDEVGFITLSIPANAPRYRTWAWSQRVRRPGQWAAVIRTPEGREIARERFEIEG